MDYNIHSNPTFDGTTSAKAKLPDNISLRQTVLQLDDLVNTLLTRNSRTCRPSGTGDGETVPRDHREQHVVLKVNPATGNQVHGIETHVGQDNHSSISPHASVSFPVQAERSELSVSQSHDMECSLECRVSAQTTKSQQSIDFDLIIDAVMMELQCVRVRPIKDTLEPGKPTNSTNQRTLLGIFEQISGVIHCCLTSNSKLVTMIPMWSVAVKHVLRALLLDIGDRVNDILCDSDSSELRYAKPDWHSSNLLYNLALRDCIENAKLSAAVLAVVQAQQDFAFMTTPPSAPKCAEDECQRRKRSNRLEWVLMKYGSGGAKAQQHVQQCLQHAIMTAYQDVLCGLLHPSRTANLVDVDGCHGSAADCNTEDAIVGQETLQVVETFCQQCENDVTPQAGTLH